MANVVWKAAPPVWTAFVDDVAVCSVKHMEIGGYVAHWLDGHLWPPPSHLPKARPQDSRFFPNLTQAQAEIETELQR